MARILRFSWLAFRGVLAVIFVLGVIETAQGAPQALKWFKDAGVTQSPTLGVILAGLAVVLVGLVALGPERVKRWAALARGELTPPTHGRLRVERLPDTLRAPPITPPPLEVSESEAHRIAATRDQGLAAYRVFPEQKREEAKKPAPSPVLTPKFSQWLQRQYERGKDECYKINLVRTEVLTAMGGMAAIGPSFNLSELTNSANHWAKGLRSGLKNAGFMDAAAAVAGSAPSASGSPTSGDCDRLKAYVEARMKVIQNVLKGAS